MLPTIVLWSLPLLLAAGPEDPTAIVIRHDRPDSLYVRLGEPYRDVVGHVRGEAGGTLVAPRWVLTAAHILRPIGPFDSPYVLFDGLRYEVTKILPHPDWEGGWPNITHGHDIALLKLDRPVAGAEPVELYEGSDELGQVLTLVGRGKTGNGQGGAAGEKVTLLRGATNRVDGVGPTTLLLVFDEPGDATDLEGIGGSGDSGGPAFLEADGKRYLVGIASAGTGVPGVSEGLYGTVSIYTRVSAFADWIRETIAGDPPPPIVWSRPARAAGPGDLPDTPAGRAAADFLEAYGVGTMDALTGYFERYSAPDHPSPPTRRAEVMNGFREGHGPLELVGYVEAGPHRMRLLVYSAASDRWWMLAFDVDEAPPHHLRHLFGQMEAPPEPGIWRGSHGPRG